MLKAAIRRRRGMVGYDVSDWNSQRGVMAHTKDNVIVYSYYFLELTMLPLRWWQGRTR
jgi:hypothetical protein